MNSSKDIPPKPIRLTVLGLGHVPSFKNGKMLARGRLITDPKKQKWMEKAAASIGSQLSSLSLIAAAGTETAQSARSWTLSCLPLDDDLDWIGVPCGSWQRVKKGDEGCEVLIEKLT